MKLKILGYNIWSENIEKIKINRSPKLIINTINAYSYTLAKKDIIFREALINSDILVPDGIGLVLGAKIIHNRSIKKISGYVLFLYIMAQLEHNGGKCFFLGGSQSTLIRIQKKALLNYPSVKVDFYSPPFKNNFNINDNEIIYNKVNKFKPNVLFVGMTAPKQEKWVFQNINNISANVICTIGAVFDFYSGVKPTSNKLISNLGFEWLHRLITDYNHMKYRYHDNPIYTILSDIFWEKVRKPNETNS